MSLNELGVRRRLTSLSFPTWPLSPSTSASRSYGWPISMLTCAWSDWLGLEKSPCLQRDAELNSDVQWLAGAALNVGIHMRRSPARVATTASKGAHSGRRLLPEAGGDRVARSVAPSSLKVFASCHNMVICLTLRGRVSAFYATDSKNTLINKRVSLGKCT